MTIKVLFVCLGNICRSPTAHGVFQHVVDEAGLSAQIEVESAGTASWHIGESPDKRSIAHAHTRGYDLSALRALQATPKDFKVYDYILAMDNDNLSNLNKMKPKTYQGHLGLFLHFCNSKQLCGSTQYEEVPDPYYGGAQGFDTVLDLVESASAGLLDDIKSKFLA